MRCYALSARWAPVRDPALAGHHRTLLPTHLPLHQRERSAPATEAASALFAAPGRRSRVSDLCGYATVLAEGSAGHIAGEDVHRDLLPACTPDLPREGR